MKYDYRESEKNAVYQVANLMLAAARTAPKGHGIDNLIAMILDGDEKKEIVEELKKMSEETGEPFYARDAGNVDASPCLVLLAARNKPVGMTNCSLCGFKNCAEAVKAGSNCTFNITDLGIACGSAVSIAADNRIDNRVLFSAGKAAVRLGIFDDEVRVCYGIPLSTSAKSIFFDRGAQKG